MKKFLLSFTYAWKGLRYAFQTQLNFKVHCFLALFAISLGLFLGLSNLEWLLIFLIIGLVMITELINTALETLVDFISPEYHPQAGIIKDVAAGAVLMMACIAVLIGLIIFGPKVF